MEHVTLNNGVKMPKLGLGVFRITDQKEAEDVVAQAIEHGYRFIDTAAAYGNEEAVGRGIRRSGIPREELFVTSKLWLTDNSEGGAARGLERSLKKLGMDYVDLYLIHQPLGDIYGAWRGLTRALYDGKIRAIGVDNFTQARLVEFVEFGEVKPAVNMVDASVFNQREADRSVMAEMGVQMGRHGRRSATVRAMCSGTPCSSPLVRNTARQRRRSFSAGSCSATSSPSRRP